MKTIAICCAVLICAFLGCETTNYIPPVTPEMAAAAKQREKRIDVAELERGRTLLAHRCIECHTLPVLWHYTPKDWSGVVDDMAHRASLKPAERDAVVAYILAARAQER
ncbi:MAG TPA: hypothetical protein VFP82_02560 [Chthoniobacterales bacterium]|nr:hypothetical protein [Chthoniobacterales bacterium]